MSGVAYPYRFQYEHVSASSSAQVLGGAGATGDYIQRLICTVTTAATSSVVIVDGTGTGILTHTVLPNNVGQGIGCYVIEVECASVTGPWKITTGAGVECMAVGIFSA
jgi:hypothetical protein